MIRKGRSSRKNRQIHVKTDTAQISKQKKPFPRPQYVEGRTMRELVEYLKDKPEVVDILDNSSGKEITDYVRRIGQLERMEQQRGFDEKTSKELEKFFEFQFNQTVRKNALPNYENDFNQLKEYARESYEKGRISKIPSDEALSITILKRYEDKGIAVPFPISQDDIILLNENSLDFLGDVIDFNRKRIVREVKKEPIVLHEKNRMRRVSSSLSNEDIVDVAIVGVVSGIISGLVGGAFSTVSSIYTENVFGDEVEDFAQKVEKHDTHKGLGVKEKEEKKKKSKN